MDWIVKMFTDYGPWTGLIAVVIYIILKSEITIHYPGLQNHKDLKQEYFKK
jgi:hypothetical protein